MASTDLDPVSGSSRPQAGPLPRKRGEFGYQESTIVSQDDNSQLQESEDITTWPARHPADTHPTPDPHPATTASEPVEDTVATLASDGNVPVQFVKANARARLFKQLFRCKRKFLGIQLTLILRCFVQFTLLSGTVVAWVIVARKVMGRFGGPDVEDDASISGPASIFVHVTFGIATIAQLLYLERCVFVIRAQRYVHSHRIEEPPTTGRRRSSRRLQQIRLAIALAPWNRPPLPTYAAALAEVNPGTGDVEDLEIAVPPPPAYGNTRGSTLLLSNITRNSWTSLVIGGSTSRHSSMAGGRRSESWTSRRERPSSLRSLDEASDGRADAERALRLAETLNALERGSSTSVEEPRADEDSGASDR